MIKLLEWTFPHKKIEEHRLILQEAEHAIEKIEAALDGETGWLNCGCVEKSETVKESDNVALSYPQRSKCLN